MKNLCSLVLCIVLGLGSLVYGAEEEFRAFKGISLTWQKDQEAVSKEVEDLRNNEHKTELFINVKSLFLPIDVTPVLTRLKRNKTLTTFCLHSNLLDNNVAAEFAEVLKYNTTLKTFCMASGYIHDWGVLKFCEALTVNKTLTTFALCCNNVFRTDTATKICKALKDNATLTTFYLYGYNLDDELKCIQYLKPDTLSNIYLVRGNKPTQIMIDIGSWSNSGKLMDFLRTCGKF